MERAKLQIVYVSLLILLYQVVSAQVLPDLTFQNIDIWPLAKDGNNVGDVIEDKHGFLWLRTTMGVYRYDGYKLHTYVQSADTNTINENSTSLIYIDTDSDIWVGTSEGGLNKYIPELDHFERLFPPNSEIGRISQILEDGKTHFWIAAREGLFYYDRHTNKVEKYVPSETPRHSRGEYFMCVVRTEHYPNMLWVAGLDGFYKFDIATKRFEYLDMNFGYREYPYYPSRDLHWLTKQDLIGGSWGGGVIEYHSSTKRFSSNKPEEVEDGRWHSVIFSTLPEDENNIWVAGGAGFGMFNRELQEFAFYKWDDADPTSIDSSFHYSGLLKTISKNMVVTRVNGISISSSLEPHFTTLKFKPVISEIRVDGQPLFTDTAIHYVEHLDMQAQDKDLSITILAPGNYDKSATFSYFLEGYDRTWVALPEGRTVRYTNLPAGQYTFRYRAGLDGENWIEGSELNIDRSVFFWNSAWFIVTGLITISLIVIFIYQLKVNSIRREAGLRSEYDKKLAEVELQALRAQMNPHFMFNSLNSIKHYILTNEPLKASEYLTNFATLIRSILHNSREKLIPLSRELDALLLYIDLEQLRFKDKFNFHCRISEEVNTDLVRIPPLILQPYVENAIWHGLLHKPECGNLEILVSKNNGSTQCIIQDNGIGRGAADQKKSKSATVYKSMGMGITENRIALRNRISKLGIKIEVVDLFGSDNEATGTRVVIIIPDASNA